MVIPPKLTDFKSFARNFVRDQRFRSGRTLVLLELERKRDVDATRKDCEPTDQPDDCERARAGLGEHDDAKGNRQQSAETEQPFAFDFSAQPYRAPDLQNTNDDCPTGDEHQQYQRGHAWPNESQCAGNNASDADNGEPPSRRYLAAFAGNRRP